MIASLCAHADTEFTYTLADGGATITGASGVGTVLCIPETIDGHPVVAIGAKAFNFELDLEQVTIPNSVTNIEEHAFALCHHLRAIVIPDSVETIGNFAFYKCYDVERIEIGSGARTIGNWAFGECYALESISIAQGVETIDGYAFGFCYSLESVTLPRSVTTVKWGAFATIPALETVYLPDSLEGSISLGAFENSPRVTVRYYHCETPIAPPPVDNIEATENLGGVIRVNWCIDSSAEVSGYKLYRAMRPHFRKAALIAELQGSERSYEDFDVSSDYTYCYWILPVNDIFEGELSEVAIGYCEDPHDPQTLYVDASNGDDSNDGSSKGSAFASLQTAIDRSADGDTIIVADGVYAPIETRNRRIVIESEGGYKNAVIDGGGASNCALLGGPEHYTPGEPSGYGELWQGTNTVLRGFTLCNGYGQWGAGVTAGTVENCLIVNNTVEAWPMEMVGPNGLGGGAYLSVLLNCTITGNSSISAVSGDDDVKYGGVGGGSWGCKLLNCIEWGNTDDPGEIGSEGGDWWSASTYEDCCLEDPLFAAAANGDYRLVQGSPCIVDGVVVAGCESEVAPAVPELTAAEAESWVSEGLATRYGKSGESAADYESRFEEKFGADPVAAMMKTTGKKDAQGNVMYVWQDYVAGTDPTDTNSVFTAKVEMVDGMPVVTWEPKLGAGDEALRSYTVYGKTNLTDAAWHSPTNEASRFFKVDVEMR